MAVGAPIYRGLPVHYVEACPRRDVAGAYKKNGNKAVVQFIELSPCVPGLGQGHETKKDMPMLIHQLIPKSCYETAVMFMRPSLKPYKAFTWRANEYPFCM